MRRMLCVFVLSALAGCDRSAPPLTFSCQPFQAYDEARKEVDGVECDVLSKAPAEVDLVAGGKTLARVEVDKQGRAHLAARIALPLEVTSGEMVARKSKGKPERRMPVPFPIRFAVDVESNSDSAIVSARVAQGLRNEVTFEPQGELERVGPVSRSVYSAADDAPEKVLRFPAPGDSVEVIVTVRDTAGHSEFARRVVTVPPGKAAEIAASFFKKGVAATWAPEMQPGTSRPSIVVRENQDYGENSDGEHCSPEPAEALAANGLKKSREAEVLVYRCDLTVIEEQCGPYGTTYQFLSRNRSKAKLEAYAARSGKLLEKKTFVGGMPRACRASESFQTMNGMPIGNSLDGTPIEEKDIDAWIAALHR